MRSFARCSSLRYFIRMGRSKKDKVVQLVPSVSTREDWLDDEAKALLRLGAMRLMREVAGVDDFGNPKELHPRTAKEAILALSLLFDRVPDVLTFDKRSNGELVDGQTMREPLDLLTPAGRATVVAAVRDLPDDIIEAAIEADE